MIDLKNNTVDLDFFKIVLKEIKNADEIGPDERRKIIDSFSANQFDSKIKLLDKFDELNILNQNSKIAIFGCWYGSILIPALHNNVEKIVAVDMDPNAIRIGRNRFFKNLKNISWLNNNVFEDWSDEYSNINLFINTSCEHMPPMREWPWWDRANQREYFAFQSNNMYHIEGHINCVSSMEEFKNQMPDNAELLFQDELVDARGSRYTIIGKF
jgi:hypothetical protein